MTKDYDYALRYDLNFDTNQGKRFKEEDVDDEKYGYCDAMVVVSIIREGVEAHDGATSHLFFSHDGQNNGEEIPITELFSVFGSLAHSLMESKLISNEKRNIAKNTVNEIRRLILGEKKFNDIWGGL